MVSKKPLLTEAEAQRGHEAWVLGEYTIEGGRTYKEIKEEFFRDKAAPENTTCPLCGNWCSPVLVEPVRLSITDWLRKWAKE